MNNFNIGDRVSFTYDGEIRQGTIVGAASDEYYLVSFSDIKNALSYTMTMHYTRLVKI